MQISDTKLIETQTRLQMLLNANVINKTTSVELIFDFLIFF